MTSTSQLTTFSDLYTDLQNRVRVTTGITATETQAKRYINVALQDMHVGYAERFPWAEREAILVTQAPYSTGTVSISKGSASLTGSGTAWNTNNSFTVKNARAGGKVKIGGSQDVYEVQSVGSDTAITFTSKFVSDDAAAQTYSYFEDEYDLTSDFLRPLDQRQFSSGIPISIIGKRDFRNRYPRNGITGKPFVCCLVDKNPVGNTTPVRRIVFHRPPDSALMIPYSYITGNLVVSATGTLASGFSADSDEPIVYLRYRHTIVFHALYHWYRDKKDDTRSQEAKSEYTDLMLRVVSDNEVGTSNPKFLSPMAKYTRQARRPYGGSGNSKRYDSNGRFDRFED